MTDFDEWNVVVLLMIAEHNLIFYHFENSQTGMQRSISSHRQDIAKLSPSLAYVLDRWSEL